MFISDGFWLCNVQLSTDQKTKVFAARVLAGGSVRKIYSKSNAGEMSKFCFFRTFAVRSAGPFWLFQETSVGHAARRDAEIRNHVQSAEHLVSQLHQKPDIRVINEVRYESKCDTSLVQTEIKPPLLIH